MGYEKRTWNLGRVLEVVERHTCKWMPPGMMRRKKKEKPTPEAVKRNNQKMAARKRKMQLEMYFDENDIYITLTYPKDKRPADMKECQKDWKKLMAKVGKTFKRNGAVLRWIRNAEAGTHGAYHIHAVVKELPAGSIGPDGQPTTAAKLIQKIWRQEMGYGRCDSQYLQSDVTALAEYITKTPESSKGTGHAVIEAKCSASRNMPLPEPEVKEYGHWKTFLGRDIKVPKGWILDKSSVHDSINPFTGFPRREYRLIKAEGVRRC